MKYIYLIIVCLGLLSCASAPKSNYILAKRIMDNPDSLLSILKDSTLTKVKSEHYKKYIEDITINLNICRIKLLNSEGYDISRDVFARFIVHNEFTGILRHVITYKSKITGKTFILLFDNSDSGIWKLIYILRDGVHH